MIRAVEIDHHKRAAKAFVDKPPPSFEVTLGAIRGAWHFRPRRGARGLSGGG